LNSNTLPFPRLFLSFRRISFFLEEGESHLKEVALGSGKNWRREIKKKKREDKKREKKKKKKGGEFPLFFFFLSFFFSFSLFFSFFSI